MQVEAALESWSRALQSAATTHAELPGIYLGLADVYLRGPNPSLAAQPLSLAIHLLEQSHGPRHAALTEPIRRLADLASRQGCHLQAQALHDRLAALADADTEEIPIPQVAHSPQTP